MGAYWVGGVGNEVFVGAGALSVVVVFFTYFLIKTIAIRRRIYTERGDGGLVSARMALPARDLGHRGVVGDSAEPDNCPVSLLLPCAALSSSTNPELWQMVLAYNQRMSGQSRSLVQYLYDIPLILGHVWRLLFTAEGIALLCRLHILLLLLLSVLYLLSPLDLIPEAVFGALGLLDDLIILVAVATYASQLYRNYITNG
ncbi:E3 ubiquitin-protein ligase RNF170 [Geodia barretti]|uniref:E3 ubiquitin-protein ligase RNF170 n=1 Tax=Geodia barretti TaxID=519541 RepID=A0AA35RMD0_GEOBA|nr:E3 ubiquitin-protein ligase RNF170 [Geodia barretti]